MTLLIMNILFLTEIAPFPTNGGEKLRSYGLLKLMSELNITVHAIIGDSGSTKTGENNLRGIQFYPFDFSKNKGKSRTKKYYHLFTPDKELILLINKILKNGNIDLAFIDYFFYGQYIDFFRNRNIPVIYGTHNAQAELIYQRPAVSFRNRITMRFDYWVNRLHESYYFRKAEALIVVSDKDKAYHAGFVNSKKIFVIPNFLVESEYLVSTAEKENYILMTANFRAYQNTAGLEWFVKEVWDEEIWSKTQLLLLGINSKEILSVLSNKYTVSNIKALGEIDDLKPFISRARLSIVPLLHGSGSRLKCLESMALKTQLLATSKGAEGIIHDDSILIADSPGEFKNKLLQVLISKANFTDKAYMAFLSRYSLPPNELIFTDIIRRITSNKK
jgi:hypothetical protein